MQIHIPDYKELMAFDQIFIWIITHEIDYFKIFTYAFGRLCDRLTNKLFTEQKLKDEGNLLIYNERPRNQLTFK